MACPPGNPEIPEENYNAHMAQLHGGSQATGRFIKNNVPPLPNGVTPADLPSPEFMEVAKQIDSPQPHTITTAKPPTIITEKKPLELTYKYIGNCENGHSVSTLEMDVEEKHFVVAFCLQCNKQVESREVVSLKKEKKFLVGKKEVTAKVPSVVAKPSALPKAKLNDKPQKDQTEGTKEKPIIS